jgi:hypothetical protein
MQGGGGIQCGLLHNVYARNLLTSLWSGTTITAATLPTHRPARSLFLVSSYTLTADTLSEPAFKLAHCELLSYCVAPLHRPPTDACMPSCAHVCARKGLGWRQGEGRRVRTAGQHRQAGRLEEGGNGGCSMAALMRVCLCPLTLKRCFKHRLLVNFATSPPALLLCGCCFPQFMRLSPCDTYAAALHTCLLLLAAILSACWPAAHAACLYDRTRMLP